VSDASATGAPILRPWSLAYEGFDPVREGLREALCALGNGRFASRGAAPEADADGVHYPGTYVASCYNRLTSTVAGREVEDESLVNLPNSLPLTFRIEEGEWFGLATVGLETRDEVLWLNPRLPVELTELRLKICYRRHWGLEIRITRDRVSVRARPAEIAPIRIGIKGEVIQLGAGTTVERPL
jgi:trehalose/maltose hydrolase-like predicted phosphorylase